MLNFHVEAHCSKLRAGELRILTGGKVEIGVDGSRSAKVATQATHLGKYSCVRSSRFEIPGTVFLMSAHSLFFCEVLAKMTRIGLENGSDALQKDHNAKRDMKCHKRRSEGFAVHRLFKLFPRFSSLRALRP